MAYVVGTCLSVIYVFNGVLHINVIYIYTLGLQVPPQKVFGPL